jgi:hypothetical protein
MCGHPLSGRTRGQLVSIAAILILWSHYEVTRMAPVTVIREIMVRVMVYVHTRDAYVGDMWGSRETVSVDGLRWPVESLLEGVNNTNNGDWLSV